MQVRKKYLTMGLLLFCFNEKFRYSIVIHRKISIFFDNAQSSEYHTINVILLQLSQFCNPTLDTWISFCPLDLARHGGSTPSGF